MAESHPRQIIGRWREGFALDVHTLSSTPVGHDEFGHMQFDTRRSELGDLLYRLKFKSDAAVVPEIAEAAATFMRGWKPGVEMIAPVPPSNPRAFQPVIVLANALSERLDIPLKDCVKRLRNAPQLKNIYDLDERLRLLDGLHAVNASATDGRRVLLFDDLYRSGATMNAITTLLYDQGKASAVFALTITRTRSHR
ncbi:MAG: phosphoribosyltransferase family protein [Syntrophobacteraceae bacterium]